MEPTEFMEVVGFPVGSLENDSSQLNLEAQREITGVVILGIIIVYRWYLPFPQFEL